MKKCSLTALMRFIHPTNGDRHLNPSAWRAMGWHAQDSSRRAPPFTPQKPAAGALENRSAHSRKRLPRERPPMRMPSKAARAAATRRAPQHSWLRHTLAARHAKTAAARRRGGPDCAQPRCARGNLKGRPKAWTKMTKGTSGAKAPDRNRGRAQSGPPRRWATYEALTPSAYEALTPRSTNASTHQAQPSVPPRTKNLP